MIPVGISDFEEIREKGYYYIDKSGLITDILKNEATKVTLITRPRRFGKTMAMSMLASFFDIEKDSMIMFDGLKVAKNNKMLCEKWMNQCPVIFLSFKDVDGRTFENAFELLKFTIAQFCDAHAWLENSEKVTDAQKMIFKRLKNGTASMIDVQTSLCILIKMMYAHYDRKVILLLDEYDVPVAKASDKGYYAEMMEVMKTVMSTSLKDNPSLEFAVVTGCLKIAKESIFTGTNNFVSDTIAATGLDEYFGFTQDDIDKMLQDADIDAYAAEVKEWYDGYHFGETDVYCPWDVMNYMRDLQTDPDRKPASYWKNTSDNAIIRSFIDYAGGSISRKLELLLSGGYVKEHIEENLTYDYLHSSEENLWSVLYLTGYLTTVRKDELPESLEEGETALKIPNKEIREIFESTVKKWFEDYAKETERHALFAAVWSGESDKLTKEMSKLLRVTISYHDYKEDFYHAFLAGIFAGAGYTVESNKEHGEGRSDIVVYDAGEGRAAVFEVKNSKTLNDMEEDCEKALEQIRDRNYAESLRDEYEEVICYGVAFYKKRCAVKREKRMEM